MKINQHQYLFLHYQLYQFKYPIEYLTSKPTSILLISYHQIYQYHLIHLKISHQLLKGHSRIFILLFNL